VSLQNFSNNSHNITLYCNGGVLDTDTFTGRNARAGIFTR